MKSKNILAAAAALCASGAHAQTQAPGLWEQSMSMKSAGGEMDPAMAEMHRQLAAMPPEQRRQAEQAMAGRGMRLGALGSTVKVCVSAEQAARAAEPALNGDCTTSDVQRSGNSVKFRFACTKPQASSGEGQWTFASDKAYTGRLATMAPVAGQPQRMTMEMTGKWLSADCGDIKPRPLPAK